MTRSSSTLLILFFVILCKTAYSQNNEKKLAILEDIRNSNNSFFYNSIYSIETDNFGYIYLATDKGLFYYNGTNITPYSLALIGNNNEYIKLYKPNDTFIYLLPYYGTIKRITLNGHTSFEEIKNQSKEIYTLYCAYKDTNNQYNFIGSLPGLDPLRLTTDTNFKLKHPFF
jgi:ligand-binding sensor domain-containing protein